MKEAGFADAAYTSRRLGPSDVMVGPDRDGSGLDSRSPGMALE